MIRLALAFTLALSLSGVAGAAPATVPPVPASYVYDEPGVTSGTTKTAVNRLLYRHDRATGEQVVIAIFDTLGEADLVQRTHEIFQAWGIGARGKDSGVLVALYWKERRARIEVGYGLEPTLTDVKSRELIEDVLVPYLRAGQTDDAISQVAVGVLRALGTPIADSPQARPLLPGTPGVNSRSGTGWVVWLFLGIVLVSIVGNLMSSADAHFSGRGWYRPRPWRRRRWVGGSTGPAIGGFRIGGFEGSGVRWGGGGSGGGFTGGGGRSGGGGASGAW